MRDAFQLAFGDPTKEQLQRGMSIYKFNGNRLINGTDLAAVTDATPLSPWWSPTYGFKRDAGLEQRMAVAEKLGVSFANGAGSRRRSRRTGVRSNGC